MIRNPSVRSNACALAGDDGGSWSLPFGYTRNVQPLEKSIVRDNLTMTYAMPRFVIGQKVSNSNHHTWLRLSYVIPS